MRSSEATGDGAGPRALGDSEIGPRRGVALGVEDGRFHTHVIGATGSGKSTLLATLALADMAAGRGVVVIDPKGDLVVDLLARIPRRAMERLVLIDPEETEAPPSLNVRSGEPAQVAVDHVVSVFARMRLNDALLPFLATALFGPERTGYWRPALDATAEPERTAPARERASEIEAEIADLERRIGRQLVNLEADDVTPALRRRVGERVAELEDAIVVRRERLVALVRASATEAPTLADVAPLLGRLPILAGMLDSAPQGELQALFDSLQLDVVYQPVDSAIDVAATLYDLGSETAQSVARESAEDWSAARRGAPPAGLEPATRGLGNHCSIL